MLIKANGVVPSAADPFPNISNSSNNNCMDKKNTSIQSSSVGEKNTLPSNMISTVSVVANESISVKDRLSGAPESPSIATNGPQDCDVHGNNIPKETASIAMKEDSTASLNSSKHECSAMKDGMTPDNDRASPEDENNNNNIILPKDNIDNTENTIAAEGITEEAVKEEEIAAERTSSGADDEEDKTTSTTDIVEPPTIIETFESKDSVEAVDTSALVTDTSGAPEEPESKDSGESVDTATLLVDTSAPTEEPESGGSDEAAETSTLPVDTASTVEEPKSTDSGEIIVTSTLPADTEATEVNHVKDTIAEVSVQSSGETTEGAFSTHAVNDGDIEESQQNVEVLASLVVENKVNVENRSGGAQQKRRKSSTTKQNNSTATVPAFRKVPSAQIVKGCIRTILAVMRVQKYAPNNKAAMVEETAYADIHLHPIYVQLQSLLQTIGANPDQASLLGPTPSDTHVDSDDDDEDSDNSHNEQIDKSESADDEENEDEHEDDDDNDDDEDDDDDIDSSERPSKSFLYPFCEAVKRRDVGAAVTGAVLTALHKFISLDILTPDQEIGGSNLTAERAIRMIANALIVCTFEEATEVVASVDAPGVTKRTSPSRNNSGISNASRDTSVSTTNNAVGAGPSFAVSNGDAEQSVLKLLDVIVATVDYSIRNGRILSPNVITKLLATCLHVTHRAASASFLLRSAAATAATKVVTVVFHDNLYADDTESEMRWNETNSYWLSIFRKLKELLDFPTGSNTTSSTLNVLTLLNIALESIQGQILPSAEKEFLKIELFQSILSTAMETRDCGVLESAIRAVYNLWVCMRRELKGEFEVFLLSVHFRILDYSNKEESYKEEVAPGRWRKISGPTACTIFFTEAREIVLESLLDICRFEPNILQEIYFNYDCDVSCSNLFETIMTALGKVARPLNWINPTRNVENSNIPLSRANSNVSATMSIGSKEPGPMIETTAPSEVQLTSKGTSQIATANATTNDTPANRRQPPLNPMNILALDGILSALYSFAAPPMDDEPENDQYSHVDNDTEGWIVEVSKTGEITVVSEDLLHSRKRKKHSLQTIARAFSESNDDWLGLAVTEGMMPESFPLTSFQAAKVAAEILYNSNDVDKAKLGTYLSKGPEKRYPFEAMVRKEFAALHDFTGMTFPVALRSFLSKFRMPGEAQCIDRIMEVFSREYYAQQGETTVFKNSDAVYVLAFSTIMLNTDLHNRTIKAGARMTREQFVRNNRGINAGEDLEENFLTDLYDQIKEREIQVRREVGELTKTSEQEDFRTTWDGLQSKKTEMAAPVYLRKSSSHSQNSRIHDKEMFLIFANASVQSLTGAFARTRDDATVVKLLRGLKHIVYIAASFGLDSIINDIVQILLAQGREYITSCVALDYAGADDGASVGSNNAQTNVSVEYCEEDLNGIDADQPIPYELLRSSTKQGVVNIAGCAAHKGLLALDTGFVLFRKHSSLISAAWPAFMECMCALRDARALPEGLSELDDFADSNGNVLPLSSYAVSSKKALDDHYRSLSGSGGNKNKGWFRSFFRGNSKSAGQDETLGGGVPNNGELSIYTKALLSVAEAAEVEDAVQMGSMKLPEATLEALLATVSEYPFVNDPVGEQQAVFSLELAARALLSDRGNAIAMFPHFLGTFEGILCSISGEQILSPFVIERVVVAILRCSIHLYEIPELRPSLRSSLQFITTTLPKSFIKGIADRMACGMAIILRASFQFFESANEWTFMGDTLDMLANYSSSREFVFDGIASTVEYAIPSVRGSATDGSDNPQLSLEACESLSRILIRFTLGFYKGDLSLIVPAMLCLEKVYRFKVELLLRAETPDQPAQSADRVACAPDKELWQNVAVAVYSVCRSSEPETSRHGMDCFRRIILRTRIDQIPEEKWIAILYLMVHKQPPLVAELSRGNTFTLLGQLLARVLPSITHKKELKDDLEDLISQVAALSKENLLQNRRGTVSPLFEKTLQTTTYLSNHMTSDEWAGEKQFSVWASEKLFKELERAGANIEPYNIKQNVTNNLNMQDPAVESDIVDESEVSELSATDVNGDDNETLN